MRLDDLPQYYFSYTFPTRPVADGYDLKVSTAFTEAGNHWRTVPWYQHNVVPDDPAAPVISVGGWTFLYGGPAGAVFDITAAVGAGEVVPQASTHLQLVAAAPDSDDMAASWEGWEWFVGDLEGNTAHWTGAWHGRLAAGHRLRLRLDYWHAPHLAKMNRAHVEGSYWRLPA